MRLEEVTVKNVKLVEKDGVYFLKADKVISYRENDEKVIKPLKFQLVEVTTRMLTEYRKNKVPTFVLKIGERLYFSKIPFNFNMENSEILSMHKCYSVGHTCMRLSSASDELGGCEKVRNYGCCIEKYPWITFGCETFNTLRDVLIVIECLHFKETETRKKISEEELNQAKLCLAQFMWDDISTFEDFSKRVDDDDKKKI